MAQKPIGDDDEEQPLDPSVERVRKKLVRFVAINLGLLAAALMVVVLAVVYKTFRSPEPGDSPLTEAEIALPAGAKMIGHGFCDGQLSLDAELVDGSRIIFLYDVAAGKIVGRYTVTTK